jgi:hypothetical protein
MTDWDGPVLLTPAIDNARLLGCSDLGARALADVIKVELRLSVGVTVNTWSWIYSKRTGHPKVNPHAADALS